MEGVASHVTPSRSAAVRRPCVVPAALGEYEIINLGAEPIRIHKTLLKDGFEQCEP